MLPPAHRLRRSSDFSSTVRSGTRTRAARLVVHAQPGQNPDAPLVGFVVSKAVGGSVVRHRVTRRLRAQVAARLGELPAGARLVIRALPSSATATSAELGADLDTALARWTRRR